MKNRKKLLWSAAILSPLLAAQPAYSQLKSLCDIVSPDPDSRASQGASSSQTLHGILEVAVADDENLRHTVHSIIYDKQSGKRYKINQQDVPAQIQPGDSVRVDIDASLTTKTSTGCSFTISKEQTNFFHAAFDSLNTTQNTGDQRTLVMLVSYQSNHNIGSDQVQYLQDTLFQDPEFSANKVFQESSYGKVSLSGDVVGPFVIPEPQVCNQYGDATNADNAAKAAGVNLGSYTRKIYVYANSATSDTVRANCRWVGLGSYGSIPTQAWIVYLYSSTGLYAHEMGHNLGMHHASSDPTSTLNCAPLGSGIEGIACNEGGDRSDVLGSAPIAQFNAPHRVQTNWLPSANLAKVTQSGTFKLAPLERDLTQGSNVPQVLVFPKADSGDDYYLSYRAGEGIDKLLPSQMKNRLSVHRWSTGRLRQTILMKTLSEGESFEDQSNKIALDQVSIGSDGLLSVRVTLNKQEAEPCIAAGPTLALSPTSIETTPGGQSAVFKLTVTNNDSATCADTEFRISSDLPNGFSPYWVRPVQTLKPGQSGTTELWAYARADQPEGSYPIPFFIKDSLDTPVHSASITGEIELNIYCKLYKPTIGVLPGYQTISRGQKADILLIIQNRDDVDCPDSTFQLRAITPAGSSAVFEESTVRLAPRKSKFINMTVYTTSEMAIAEHLIRFETYESEPTPEHENFTHAAIKVIPEKQ